MIATVVLSAQMNAYERQCLCAIKTVLNSLENNAILVSVKSRKEVEICKNAYFPISSLLN